MSRRKKRRVTHHRKPVSQGGADIEENFFHPFGFQHRAWHTLVANCSADDILQLLEKYYRLFGKDGKSEYQLFLDQELIQATKGLTKKQRAWNLLFAGATLEQIIKKVNRTWLDPDYALVIADGTVLTETEDRQ